MKKTKIVVILLALAGLLLVGCGSSQYGLIERLLFYSGSEGGKTKYTAAPTEVVFLEDATTSDMAPIICRFEKNEEGGFFGIEYWNQEADMQPVDEEIMAKLNAWVDEYDIRSWDGFDMTQKHVMDGSGFRLSITLSTGETIYAHGSNAYPKGYREAMKALEEIEMEAEGK